MATKRIDLGFRTYGDGSNDVYPYITEYENCIAEQHEYLFRFLGMSLEPVRNKIVQAAEDMAAGENVQVKELLGMIAEIHPYLSDMETAKAFLAKSIAEHLLDKGKEVPEDQLRKNPLYTMETYTYWMEHAGKKDDGMKGSIYSLQMKQRELVTVISVILDDTHEELRKRSAAEREALYASVFSISDEAELSSFQIRNILHLPSKARLLQASVEFDDRDRLLRELHALSEGAASFQEMNKAFKLLSGITSSSFETVYEAAALEDILDLEMSDMIRMNTRVKRCERCGRFFVYSEDNPDRCTIMENGKSCLSEYRTVSVNKLYQKAYKTHHKRMKRGGYTEEDLRNWMDRAKKAKDPAISGEMTMKEFESIMKE